MSALTTFSVANLATLLAIALAVGVGIGWAIERALVRQRRTTWRAKYRPDRRNGARVMQGPRTPESSFVHSKPTDAADQLRIVMDAKFTTQPLLNKSEARVFRELDRYVLSCNPEWQVMAQVSLGEILRSKDPAAFSCINSKRVDLLLMDENCQPRHAIEYQGGAHHKGTAAARDAIKKEALRRAGIGYHEVISGQTTPAELRQLVEKLVDEPEAPTPTPTVQASLRQ